MQIIFTILLTQLTCIWYRVFISYRTFFPKITTYRHACFHIVPGTILRVFDIVMRHVQCAQYVILLQPITKSILFCCNKKIVFAAAATTIIVTSKLYISKIQRRKLDLAITSLNVTGPAKICSCILQYFANLLRLKTYHQ